MVEDEGREVPSFVELFWGLVRACAELPGELHATEVRTVFAMFYTVIGTVMSKERYGPCTAQTCLPSFKQDSAERKAHSRERLLCSFVRTSYNPIQISPKTFIRVC